MIRLSSTVHVTVRTPSVFLPKVWPKPLSLATTRGISFDFFSSPYLDVSVREVPFMQLCIHCMIHISSICGFPHSEICGWAYLQLTAAYRSLSRPSSAPDAKAFTLCSCSLLLSYRYLSITSVCSLNCLSFIFKQIRVCISTQLFFYALKRLLSFVLAYISTIRFNCNIFLPFRKNLFFIISKK